MLLNRRFSAKKAPIATLSRPRRFVPLLQLLERREVLSTLLVTTNNTLWVTTNADHGPGSLREAIIQANLAPEPDTIYFNIGAGIQTITLESALPKIRHPVTIDGYGQGQSLTPKNQATPNTLGTGMGTNANLSVQLTCVGGASVGLDVNASDTVIRGLSIYGFSSAAILIDAFSIDVQVLGSFIGAKADGSPPDSKNAIGIEVDGDGNNIGSPANADRNLISGNVSQGVLVLGNDNVVRNNLIGTTKLGGAAPGGVLQGNGLQGVLVQGSDNFIGGLNAQGGNIISGNANNGVEIVGAGPLVTDNQVEYNSIGTDASGKVAAPNAYNGVILDNTKNTTIAFNVIAANNPSNSASYAGVRVGQNLAPNDDTVIKGNRIGVGADGLKKLGNGGNGIQVENSTNTTIGGTAISDRNIIAGNLGNGISVENAGVLIEGNYIGVVGAQGITPTGNMYNGIEVDYDNNAMEVQSNGNVTIGGTASGAGNVISGNGRAGVELTVLNSGIVVHDLIQGNFIGVGGDGLTAVGNATFGIDLERFDTGLTVGGSTPAARNVISGNGGAGVDVYHCGGSPPLMIQANLIGLNATGTAAVGNVGPGVMLDSSNGVMIGGASGCIISGNLGGGVVVHDSQYTQITNTFIGVDSSGTKALPNKKFGIQVDGQSPITAIGGSNQGNVISGNSGPGINVLSAFVQIQGNKIGTDSTGKAAVPNDGDGISIQGTYEVTVGGTTVLAGNVISGNHGNGVDVENAPKAVVTIQGNKIGTTADGSAPLGNSIGVNIVGSTGVHVGETDAGAGNLISGNRTAGVNLSNSQGILVAGNKIGTAANGLVPISNGSGLVETSSTGLTIGGTTPNARNVISGNKRQGVSLVGGSEIVVQGNYIGLTLNGDLPLGNGTNGIEIDKSAPLTNTTIGGTSLAASNVISGNVGSGILLDGAGAQVAVLGNLIGTDRTGQKAVGNTTGITLANTSTNATIGLYSPGSGNVISGNRADGVDALGGNATLGGNFIGLALDLSKLGNGGYGVLLAGNSNTIGQGDYISGNVKSGVRITGSNNVVSQSYIGNNSVNAAANPIGIEILGDGNRVGASVISGNTGDGVLISGSNNVLKGNLIGLLLDGATVLANGGAGVHIKGGSNNSVGGTGDTVDFRNIISGNTAAGVLVENTSGAKILQNYIGTSSDGKTAIGNGNSDKGAGTTAGVIISTGAINTVIGGGGPTGGNLISGSDRKHANGVQVQGNAKGTLILGNTIGLMAGGTGSLGNVNGILIRDTAANTTIGGTLAGAGNLIGFNSIAGIGLIGTPTNTLIQGNRIGLDKTGDLAGNRADGIIVSGGSGTTIGGSAAGAGNVISGNGSSGIDFNGATVTGTNVIQGNFVGTDPSGTSARGNVLAGVLANNLTAGKLNIVLNTISGNRAQGVLITHSRNVSIGGVIPGGFNFIGLSGLGTNPLPNGGDGVRVMDSTGIVIGGSNSGNYISGNTGDGVHVGGASTGTMIVGNVIGLSADADQVAANLGNGINVTDTASNTTIGGTGTGVVNNVISGNALNGVNIDTNRLGTRLYANNIGLNNAQTSARGNGGDGVHVLAPAVQILGNGTGPGANSVIAGNKGNGIDISGLGAFGALVKGYRIGTNGAGATTLGNGLDGVLVENGANGVTIGDTSTGGGNIIGANGRAGIHVFSTGTPIQGTLIQANQVSPNHLYGIFLDGTFTTTDSIRSVVIGGSNAASNDVKDIIVVSNAMGTRIDTNTISKSRGDGIRVINESGVNGSGVFQTLISNNLILDNAANGVEFDQNAKGLTLTNNRIAGNALNGVLINGQTVTIGGTTTGQGNTITSNTGNGIQVGATAVNIAIQGNNIGTNSLNSVIIGNTGDGILVTGGVENVTIGGPLSSARNVISGNTGNGIHLQNVTSPVQVLGNLIGVSSSGNTAIGNTLDGLLLEASTHAQIQANVISANGQNGVELKHGSGSNALIGNKIGVGSSGTTALGNVGFGVWVHQGSGGAVSSGNTIGGKVASAGNIIGFNKEGVVIGDSPTDSSQGNAIEANSIFKSSALIDLGKTGLGTYTPVNNAGPNLLEVPPTLTGATVVGSVLKITGQLNGTGKNKTTFRLEFFAADPILGGFKTFLGALSVTTDGSGNVPNFSISFTEVGFPLGTQVSATATDPNGNTTGVATAINAKNG